MKWGARIHLEGKDRACSGDVALSREARGREAAVVWTWSYQMTNTGVWSCFSVRCSKQRWVWWAPSPRTPIPAVIRTCSVGSLLLCLQNMNHLFVESFKKNKYIYMYTHAHTHYIYSALPGPNFIMGMTGFHYKRHLRSVYLLVVCLNN